MFRAHGLHLTAKAGDRHVGFEKVDFIPDYNQSERDPPSQAAEFPA
jgi:hypothetical protein